MPAGDKEHPMPKTLGEFGMGEGFCGYSADEQGVKQKYVKANPRGYDFIQAIDPNDVQELVRIYMENNGIKGLRQSLKTNHEMITENQKLKDTAREQDKRLTFYGRIIEKLVEGN